MTTNDFVKVAVIGHPVTHSKSPLIHNYWMKKYGLKGLYEAIDVPADDLTKTLQKLVSEGYSGFNVTLPYKQDVLHLCNGVDALAQSIGAVNLVTIEGEHMMGSNSDAFGFVGSIKHEQTSFNFAHGPALVLGAGGATRAILHGLLDEGVPEIYLLNRTREKAEELAESTGETKRIKIFGWEERENILQDINMLANTTSLGMDGQPPLPMNLQALNKNALVTDIVYKPIKTRLILDAEANGNKIVTGIGMLLHQARPAFHKWFGIMPEIDAELERLVLA